MLILAVTLQKQNISARLGFDLDLPKRYAVRNGGGGGLAAGPMKLAL
jgi:hypothetical protein